MKPHVMCALSKELTAYLKDMKELDRPALIAVNKRLLKMQLEVSENLEKIP